MKRNFVQSSSVASVGYDEPARALEIEFVDGDVYQYLKVPAVVARDLVSAASIGKYFAHFVKTSFACIKVEN